MSGAQACLAGPPASISGLVPFENATDQTLTITEVTVRDDDVSEQALLVPVEETTIGPLQHGTIELRMALPPQTTPGEYDFQVIIAGQAVDAVAHVAPAHDVGVSPEVLVLGNEPGETLTADLVVMNLGNVPVHLDDFGSLPLHPDDVARTTLARLATTSLLDPRLVVEPLPDPAAELPVSTVDGPISVEPGEARALQLTFEIPDELSPGIRWLAALPIAMRTVLVTVVASAASPTPRRRGADR